ncbi:MAG: LapA family protein [Gammaproteobacteria bacterium]|nr:LapA family protein [Gammaproteobacteria bacterium]
MSRTIKRVFYICLFFFVFILGLVFFLKNDQVMTFNYLTGSIELPLSFLLLSTLCIGVLLGITALLPILVNMKRERSRLEKQIKVTEKEVNNLRIIPVKDTH